MNLTTKQKLVLLLLLAFLVSAFITTIVVRQRQATNESQEVVGVITGEEKEADLSDQSAEPSFKAAENDYLKTLSAEEQRAYMLEKTDTYKATINPNGIPLTPDIAASKEKEVRSLLRQFKFDEAGEVARDALNRFNAEENGEILNQLNYEAALMANLDSYDTRNLREIVSGIKDPENHFLAVLFVRAEDRDQIIVSPDSLNPVFYSPVRIKSFKIIEKEDPLVEKYLNLDEVAKVYKFNFVIDNNELYALQAEMNNGEQVFLGMFEVNKGSTYYKTVKELREALAESEQMLKENRKIFYDLN